MGRLVEPIANLDEQELRATLEDLLEPRNGHPPRVRALRREPSPYATLFPVEVLRVTLEDGGERTLFVKYMGEEQSDHPEKQCREREERIYEQLLGEPGLPVVGYYGARWSESAQRTAVFMEYVEGWSLKYHDYEHWLTAAARLAHLHAHFASRASALWQCEFLMQFDAAYYTAWAERALAVVAERSAELGEELEQIVRRYAAVADLLDRQPKTLVHNDLGPKNVLADTSHTPSRICFIDWEMAGVGCGLADLAHLKHGVDEPTAGKLCAIYCGELAGTGLVPASAGELRSVMAACELHKAMFRLWRNRVWEVPVDELGQWVHEAARLFSRI